MDKNKKMVLACVDGSSFSEAVSDYAAWIADRVDAPLKLLHTIDHHPETAPKTDLSGNIGLDSCDNLLEEITSLEQQKSKQRLKEGKELLQLAKERVMRSGIEAPVSCLQHGNLVDALIELVDNTRVLVVGIRGKIHQDSRYEIGAKIDSIIRSLHLPILVVNQSFTQPERIMLAYDGSEAAEKAIEMVANSPLFRGLTCHLVCVCNRGSTEAMLDEAAKKLRRAGGLKIISASLKGKTEQALCEYQVSQNIDMTIMGAFTHTRLHDLLLGSFTHKMLVRTNNSLLLLR